IGHSLLIIREDLLTMLHTDERSDAGALVRRVTGLQGFGFFLQGADEFVEDAALHIQALRSQANLARVEKSRPRDSRDRGLKVAIGEDDTRVLAAEFQRHRTHAL